MRIEGMTARWFFTIAQMKVKDNSDSSKIVDIIEAMKMVWGDWNPCLEG